MKQNIHLSENISIILRSQKEPQLTQIQIFDFNKNCVLDYLVKDENKLDDIQIFNVNKSGISTVQKKT